MGPRSVSAVRARSRPRARELVNAPAGECVRHLIVVLERGDEGVRGLIECRRAARFVLPAIVLALEQEPVFHGGEQLLRRAPIIREVSVPAVRRRDARAVVEVIVPQRIEPESTRLDGV